MKRKSAAVKIVERLMCDYNAHVDYYNGLYRVEGGYSERAMDEALRLGTLHEALHAAARIAGVDLEGVRGGGVMQRVKVCR